MVMSSMVNSGIVVGSELLGKELVGISVKSVEDGGNVGDLGDEEGY